MRPTPTSYREPILRALLALAGEEPGRPVKASDVTDAALSAAGVSDADEDFARQRANVNWAATQILRKEGLVGPSERRGYWALTDAGVRAAGKGPAPADEGPSPWDGDRVGVHVAFPDVPSGSFGDPYLVALASASVRCFGSFRRRDPTCGGCPIAGECVQEVLRLASGAAAPLRKRDADRGVRGPADPPRTTDPLGGLLDDLERPEPPPPPPRAPGQKLQVQVESTCVECNGKIPEGSIAEWFPMRGFAHKEGSCPT